MKYPKISRLQVVIALVIIFIAFILRFVNLESLPVFVDEAIYVRWAQVMRAEPTLRFLPQSDGKQPLFMWTVIPFQKLISDPVIAGRLVSVVTGIVTLVGVGFLSFILFSSVNVALFAALFYAISPFAVFYDRLALVDSMLSMFGIWFLIFSLLSVIYKRLDLAMIAGFALGGAFLTKSPALFFVILMPTTLLFHKFTGSRRYKTKELLKTFLRLGFAVLIGYGLYNILRLGPNFHMIALRNLDYVNPISWVFESPLDPFKPFMYDNIQYYLILGNVILVVLFLVGLFNFRNLWRPTLLALVWLVIPILIVSEYSRTMTARYIFYTVPYFTIIAGSSYLVLRDKLRPIFILLIVGFIVTAIYQNYQNIYDSENAYLPISERSGFLEGWTSGTGIRESANYVRSRHQANPNQKIVVFTEGFFGTLPDGIQAYLNDLPEITVVGIGLNFTEVPKSLLESKEFGNETYFIVNESRLKLNPEEVGLEVVEAYEKAERSKEDFEYGLYGDSRDRLLLMRLK